MGKTFIDPGPVALVFSATLRSKVSSKPWPYPIKATKNCASPQDKAFNDPLDAFGMLGSAGRYHCSKENHHVVFTVC
jgi:hypothetical protein